MTEKKFRIVNDNLIVTITNADKIFLPNDKGEQVEIGIYDQLTTQKIPMKNVKILQDFVKGELDKAVKQKDGLLEQYEPIKDIVDLDEKIVNATTKALQKGTKAFKDKAIHLSNHIKQMNSKKTIKTQLDYIVDQIIDIKKDVDGLKEAIN